MNPVNPDEGSVKRATLLGPGEFVIEKTARPVLRRDEVLVRTMACGVCTSELGMWTGKAPETEYPKNLGHEVAGVIEEVADGVSSVQVGDHVAVWVESNGYGEYVASRGTYLYNLKDETHFDLALGEPIACAVNGVRKLDPQLNDSVCLVGCGFMGLIMLQVFRLRGVGLLIAVDTRDSVLKMAKKLGATHTLNPRREDVVSAVKELTDGQGVDIGVEAVGKQETLDLATDLVRMEGKLEVFGFHQGEARKVNWGYWNWMAFQIVNGHSRSAEVYVEGMQIGLKLLEAHKLNMADLVTHRYPLERINEAFQVASKKPEGFLKGVITF